MFFNSVDIGIGLGTANILVFIKGKGIVLNEPSVVAIDKDKNKILAVGEEARQMIGRTPGNIVAIRPLKEGVIANYTITQKMLEYVVNKVAGKSFFSKPRIMVCIPTGVTSVEKRAVLEATMQAGASKTYLIEEPLAAALGAGLDIAAAAGSMVVDIGGGTTEVAVISLGGIVTSRSIRIGGDEMDEAIVQYTKRAYNLLIGERTAEAVKISIGSAIAPLKEETYELRGRDLVSGLPKTVVVTSTQIQQALSEPVEGIVEAVKITLEKTPPELASDIMDRGIVMTGGGSLLRNLDKLLSQETGMPVYVAEDALSCVALGTGKAVENVDVLKRGFMNNSRRQG